MGRVGLTGVAGFDLGNIKRGNGLVLNGLGGVCWTR